MDPIFPLVTLLLVVGAVLLWRKTNRASALLQLIACSFLFAVMWLELLAQFLSIVAGRSELLDALRSSRAQSVQWIALLIGGFGFPIGYVWHAITCKRI